MFCFVLFCFILFILFYILKLKRYAGKQFANLAPRTPHEPPTSDSTPEPSELGNLTEPVSPWLAPVVQTPRPKNPNLETPSRLHSKHSKSGLDHLDVDSDSYADSDTDLEVRAVMERVGSENGEQEALKSKPSEPTKSRSESGGGEGGEGGVSRKSKAISSITSTTVPAYPSTSTSTPSRPRSEQNNDELEYGRPTNNKVRTSSRESPKRRPTTKTKPEPAPPSPSGSTSYVPSDVHSFVNSILKKSDSSSEDDDLLVDDIPKTPKSPPTLTSHTPHSPAPVSPHSPHTRIKSSASSKTRGATPPKQRTKLKASATNATPKRSVPLETQSTISEKQIPTKNIPQEKNQASKKSTVPPNETRQPTKAATKTIPSTTTIDINATNEYNNYENKKKEEKRLTSPIMDEEEEQPIESSAHANVPKLSLPTSNSANSISYSPSQNSSGASVS
jgi:hypothetical protein